MMMFASLICNKLGMYDDRTKYSILTPQEEEKEEKQDKCDFHIKLGQNYCAELNKSGQQLLSKDIYRIIINDDQILRMTYFNAARGTCLLKIVEKLLSKKVKLSSFINQLCEKFDSASNQGTDLLQQISKQLLLLLQAQDKIVSLYELQMIQFVLLSSYWPAKTLNNEKIYDLQNAYNIFTKYVGTENDKRELLKNRKNVLFYLVFQLLPEIDDCTFADITLQLNNRDDKNTLPPSLPTRSDLITCISQNKAKCFFDEKQFDDLVRHFEQQPLDSYTTTQAFVEINRGLKIKGIGALMMLKYVHDGNSFSDILISPTNKDAMPQKITLNMHSCCHLSFGITSNTNTNTIESVLENYDHIRTNRSSFDWNMYKKLDDALRSFDRFRYLRIVGSIYPNDSLCNKFLHVLFNNHTRKLFTLKSHQNKAPKNKINIRPMLREEFIKYGSGEPISIDRLIKNLKQKLPSTTEERSRLTPNASLMTRYLNLIYTFEKFMQINSAVRKRDHERNKDMIDIVANGSVVHLFFDCRFFEWGDFVEIKPDVKSYLCLKGVLGWLIVLQCFGMLHQYVQYK